MPILALISAVLLAETAAWNEAHTRIETRRLVKHDDGTVAIERVPGGSVDGIRMVQFPLLAHGVAPWVPARSPGGAPLRWAKSCVYVSLQAELSNDVPGDVESSIFADILSHWSASTSSCSYLSFVEEAPLDRNVGYDGFNIVKFQEESWPYDSSAAGITTIFHVDRPGAGDDGTILDADVEMNSVDFAIAADCATSGTGRISDLRNTLTHEVGHVMGLDHTCWDKPGPAPLDGDGVTVSSCFPESSLTAEQLEATMYNFQDEKESKKSTVEADDIEGICRLYPIAEDPGVCERAQVEDEGCLSVAGGRRPAPFALVALGLLLLVLGRRRP